MLREERQFMHDDGIGRLLVRHVWIERQSEHHDWIDR